MATSQLALPIRTTARSVGDGFRAVFDAPRGLADDDIDAPTGFGATRYDAIVELLSQVDAPAPATAP